MITVSLYIYSIFPKHQAYTIHQYCSIVLMIPLIRLLGVCGVQGIVGLGSHGMRTRCHLLTFTFYLSIYLFIRSLNFSIMVRHRSNASILARSLRQKERRQRYKAVKSNTTSSGRFPNFLFYFPFLSFLLLSS